MGWEASRLEGLAGSWGDVVVVVVVLARLLWLEGKGGGGVRGSAGEEGVAFSIRAQVR